MAIHKWTKHDYNSDLKKCPKCGNKFPRTSKFFHKSKKDKDGFSYLCKKCKKKIDVESRKKHWKKVKKYQQSPQYVYSQLKYQAKKRGIVFEISFDYYIENLADEPCFYCGSEDTKYWIDRFLNDYEIGYTVGNSVSCCELCNKMKMVHDPEKFIAHCRRVSVNAPNIL